jgi:hypothetical protein
MTTYTYQVFQGSTWVADGFVEAKSELAAKMKVRKLHPGKLKVFVAAVKPAPTNRMRLIDGGESIAFTLETGGEFIGTVEQVNSLLRALGLAEVAVRSNLMSKKLFIEAKDTPIYCSPASESYWSM